MVLVFIYLDNFKRMNSSVLSSSANINSGHRSYETVEEVEGIKANVVFGKISKDCAGIGICKVTVNSAARDTKSNCPAAKAIISKDHYGQIAFYFKLNSMCTKCKNKFFDRDYFLVGESFLLPQAITMSLGLRNPVIEAGEYPMVKMKDYICVIFSAC